MGSRSRSVVRGRPSARAAALRFLPEALYRARISEKLRLKGRTELMSFAAKERLLGTGRTKR